MSKHAKIMQAIFKDIQLFINAYNDDYEMLTDESVEVLESMIAFADEN